MTKPTYIVSKANGLIQSSYRLTVDEQRLILACIAQIQPSEAITDQTMYQVSAREIADLAGLDSIDNTYGKIADAAKRLWRREVHITLEPDGTTKRPEEVWTRWVQTCTYSKNNAVVGIRFAKDMLPYLTELTGAFTQIRLGDIAGLSTGYAMRLYELLMQWQVRGTEEISIADLRRLMGVEDGKYESVTEFKRGVVDRAVKDINTNTNLQLTYGQRKRGRTVVALQFEFKEKQKPASKVKKLAGGKGILEAEINSAARPGESREAVIKRIRSAAKTA